MSYILDALRKSERERQAGQVPGLPDLVSDGDKKSVRWLFWLVGLLILINLGGVGYWLFLRPAPQQERVQTPVAGTSEAGATGSPVAPPPVTSANPAVLSPAAKADQAVTTSMANAGVSPQGHPSGAIAVPVPASPAPIPSPAVQPAVPVIPPVTPAVTAAPQAVPPGVAPAPPVPTPPEAVASVPVQPPNPVQVQTQPQLQSQTPAAVLAEHPASVPPSTAASKARKVQPGPMAMPEPTPSAAANPAPSTTSRELPYFPPEHSSSPRHSTARVPSAQEDDFDEVDAEMEAEGERLADARSYARPPQPSAVRHGIRAGTPHLRDLPVEFQEKVPPFKITMFAYSKNPAERFVIIDMKKSRVGDRLPGGILLLEIQTENLVLELDGQKFMIPRY
jgi:general secretion pathway protein B